MRVTAGAHRGRKLAVPAGRDVRPTSDRARQALFNILEHGGFVDGGGSPIRGAHILDAFAGSGALGLEALSRGAASATFMETAAPALDAIRQNVEACREEDKAEILRADATRPPRARVACGIIFLDPPYHKGLAAPALTALAKRRLAGRRRHLLRGTGGGRGFHAAGGIRGTGRAALWRGANSPAAVR